MIELIACVGLHWILRYGSILNRPRNIIKKIPIVAELFNCSLCLGFWSGVVVSLILKHDVFIFGCASAASCWFFDNLNNLIQRADLKLENDE